MAIQYIPTKGKYYLYSHPLSPKLYNLLRDWIPYGNLNFIGYLFIESNDLSLEHLLRKNVLRMKEKTLLGYFYWQPL